MRITAKTEDFMIEFELVELNCEKHGSKKIKIPKGIKPLCSLCLEEEAVNKEINRRKDEEIKKLEIKKLEIEMNFKQAMIPPRFLQHSFDSYIATTQEQIKNKTVMFNYALNFESNLKNGSSVILSGKVGNGKTHLACSVANYIIKNLNKTALFLSVIDALAKIKSTYTKKNEISEIDVINQFLEIDLLILDEFGIQIGSDHEKMLLFRIINKRYEYLKPIILITNLTAEQIKNFDERIFDRLKENGILLSFSGESNRKIKTNLILK